MLPIFRFHEISRAIYAVEIRADHDIVSVTVPENVTEDVAGNRNIASNILQVKHCKGSYYVLFVSV